MYQYPVIRSEQHKASLDHPEIFDFVDLSQNSGRYGVGENLWDNFRYAYNYISDHPRPINHTKTYGGERHGLRGVHDAREKYLRSIIGGCASIRFHRPPSGIGLNQDAQKTIAMIRRIEDIIPLWKVEARQDLLSARESDEAYLAADPGKKYLLYLTDGGSIMLDMTDTEGEFLLKWINVQTGEWEFDLPLIAGNFRKISAPADGGWIAVITR